MNKIVKKIVWSENDPVIKEFVISAPDIAKKHEAGQFVIIRINDMGERIPLTIADKSAENGTISIVVQEVGASTMKLGEMREGDTILDIAGPLGVPTHVEKFGTIVCVGGGVGVATMHPIAQKMKEQGNSVISILGARSKDVLVYENKMKRVSDRLIITTDDGSYGEKGFVTTALEGLLGKGVSIDLIVTIGPAIMMKMVCEVTKKYKVKTFASLNSIMLDGTGMCGACRVSIDGKIKFVCVDGPEFDGHLVDFDEMMRRMSCYEEEEGLAKAECLKKTCH